MPTVKEIYDRHIANIDDRCVSVFGYTGAQICEALEFWEKNKLKEDDLSSKIINAVAKSGYSGSIIMMELDRAGLKIVLK